MARKTFISYKYSEAQDLRDTILEKLGRDATYYQGETADSPDLTDKTTETIKEHLKDMMYGTSVTIVILSPNLTDSKWVDWEIEYTLKKIKRGDSTSRANGVVAVIMKYNDGYDWLITNTTKSDGCSARSTDKSKLYDIINENRFNRKGDKKYSCTTCKTYDWLEGSYISIIEEDTFLSNPTKYIENAHEKSQRTSDFD